MMKSILVLLTLSLFFTYGKAQTVTTRWGAIQQTKLRRDITAILGRDDDGFYALEEKDKSTPTYFLKKFDNDNNEIFTTELELKDANGKHLEFEKIIFIDGQVLLFSSKFYKSEEKTLAYVSKISSDGKQGGIKVIDEISNKRGRNSRTFDFILSNDSNRVLIYHNESKDREEQCKFCIKVINSDLKVLWEKRCVTSYKDEDFKIVSYKLSNDNKVYLLSKIYRSKSERKEGLSSMAYSILSYPPGNDEENSAGESDEDEPTDAEEYVISLGEKAISSINFELDKANNLVCAGFFSKINGSSVAGIFDMVIDSKSKNMIKKNVQDFNTATIEMFMSSQQIKSRSMFQILITTQQPKELDNFEIRGVYLNKDGGIYMVAEKYFMYETMSQSSNSTTRTSDYGGAMVNFTTQNTVTTTTQHYIYGDILIVNIKKCGEINWVSRVPKYQHSLDDDGYYSSFTTIYLEKSDKLCFMYNDHKKNLEQTDVRKLKEMGNINSTIVTMAIVDDTDNFTKAALLNNRKDKIYIRPKMSQKLDSNTQLMYGKRGKKYRFGTVKIE